MMSHMRIMQNVNEELYTHHCHRQQLNEAEEALRHAYKGKDPDVVHQAAQKYAACNIIDRLDGIVFDVGLMLVSGLDKDTVRSELLKAVDDVIARASKLEI